MSQDIIGEEDVYRFIFEEIDSVPHLEALLLLWRTRPQRWSESELSERLFVPAETIAALAGDLTRRKLIAVDTHQGDVYWYDSPSGHRDRLMEAVAEAYRQRLIRVSNLIHSKASSSVREFARAFRFTKEQK